MTDKISKSHRSWNMGRIKSANTKPEVRVRRILHKLGYRFRLHKKDMPGKPDIVLKKHGTVVFVNGCFWHRHENCRDATVPKTRKNFWLEKLNKNVERDKKNYKELRRSGWEVIIIWECELKNKEELITKLKNISKS